MLLERKKVCYNKSGDMMKKVIGVGLVIFCLIGTYFLIKPKNEKMPDMETDNSVNNNQASNEIDRKLNSLTLEEKIGQMLIVAYSSTFMDDNLKNVLTTNKPGGFILFKDNITNYEKTVKFIEEIKATSDIPMFISIDQEGGKVQRITKLSDADVSIIPPMLDIGQKKDTTLAYDIGSLIAQELQAFGINMNFAPVIDVVENSSNIIGNRSFGNDPTLVSDLGISLANGLIDNGVIPVFKHFPGHGSTIADSHYDLPVITKTKEELINYDLIPFKTAIEKGAKIIMIGHLAVPSITNDQTPASLSKVLITDLLKKEMGYEGIVVTDALNMGALTKNYSEKEIYEMAINAGVDLLLMPKSSTSAITFIKQSISEGKITEKQIDESVKKILTLKEEYLKDISLNKEAIGSLEHKKIIERVY